MKEQRVCKRCTRLRALDNSDWCRICWHGWWSAVVVLSQLRSKGQEP